MDVGKKSFYYDNALHPHCLVRFAEILVGVTAIERMVERMTFLSTQVALEGSILSDDVVRTTLASLLPRDRRSRSDSDRGRSERV